MNELVKSLEKRKRIAIYVVILFIFIALLVDYNFEITALSYFDGKYNSYFTYGLIVYKFIELLILYYILFYRYLIKLKTQAYNEKYFPKLKKHTSLLFFLIPQGNTIFGIIAYKLTSNILYFVFFSFIALLALTLLKPKKLLQDDSSQT